MDLKLFEHRLYGSVRVLMQDGEPWFVARDVCQCLGIVNNRDALGAIPDNMKGVVKTDTPGGAQQLRVVNEAGFYNLVFRSHKPEALAFQNWVCEEVLPSIRKHGMYFTDNVMEEVLNNPERFIQVLSRLAEEKKRNEELARSNEVLRDAYWNNTGKIAFANTWNRAGRAITIEEMGKVIHQQTGGGPGETNLFRWMRKSGWLCKSRGHKTQPTQWAIDKGLLKMIRLTYNYPKHGSRFYWRTYVTPLGQRELLYIFLDNRLC